MIVQKDNNFFLGKIAMLRWIFKVIFLRLRLYLHRYKIMAKEDPIIISWSEKHLSITRRCSRA